MTDCVAIVDYGSGNLRSAAKAFEHAAAELGQNLTIAVTDEPDIVRKAQRIVLPGVGAFADCRRGLQEVAGMEAAITEAVIAGGRPFLGICIGMQLMAEAGLEHGRHDGFGWISGEVRKIEPDVPHLPDALQLKVPHMGWNTLQFQDCEPHPLFQGFVEETYVYFVHSYHFQPTDPAAILARVNYGGPLIAAVGRDNLVGTQFHPEKSQAAGLALIRNFLGWRP